MSDTLNVALIGHSSSRLNTIENALQDEAGLDITRKLMLEGMVDPLDDLPLTSNVVVLDLGENWRDVLVAISNRGRRNRVPMILVGPEGDAEMTRLALKAGARDFQTHPVSASELSAAVQQLGNERPDSQHEADGELCVFVSAKGGAGTSAILAGLAHALRGRSERTDTLLVDLDLQYGSLPLHFDESSNSRLTQALVARERVDATLFDACLTRTSDGIDVLASHSDQVFSAWDIPQQTINNLFNLVCDRYRHVLVDIPRQIDPVTFQAIERASNIRIVMQQTLSDLRHARQIVGLLRDQGVANDKLGIIVNRHEGNNVLRAIDVSDAFDGLEVTTLPNDFKRMSYATDNAVSLIDRFGRAPISKDIVALADALFPPVESVPARRGLFDLRRVFAHG